MTITDDEMRELREALANRAALTPFGYQRLLRLLLKAAPGLFADLDRLQRRETELVDALRAASPLISYPENGVHWCRRCDRRIADGHAEHCSYAARCRDVDAWRERARALLP